MRRHDKARNSLSKSKSVLLIEIRRYREIDARGNLEVRMDDSGRSIRFNLKDIPFSIRVRSYELQFSGGNS
jgi:hypothetical protein